MTIYFWTFLAWIVLTILVGLTPLVTRSVADWYRHRRDFAVLKSREEYVTRKYRG